MADPYAWSNPSLVQGINMSLTAGANIPSHPPPPHRPHTTTKPSSCGIKRGMREVHDGWSRVPFPTTLPQPPGRPCAYILTISKEVLPSRYRATGQLN